MPVGCLLAAECIAQCGDAAGGISAVTRGHPLGEIGDKSRDDRRKLPPHAEKSSFPRRVKYIQKFCFNIQNFCLYKQKFCLFIQKFCFYFTHRAKELFSAGGESFLLTSPDLPPDPAPPPPGCGVPRPRFATRSRQDARRTGLAAAEITAARVAPRSLWEKYAASDENVFIYL